MGNMFFTSHALPHMPAKPARPTDLCYEVVIEPPGYRDKQPPLGATSGLKDLRKQPHHPSSARSLSRSSKLTATVDFFLTGKSCKFSGIN